MLRILHTADWHLSAKQELQKKAIKSLDFIVDFCKNNKINIFIIAGDVWDKAQMFSHDSAIGLFYKYIYTLSKLVDFVIIIKGNNAHDCEGSIDMLHEIRSNIITTERNAIYGVSFNDKKVYNLLGNNNKINKLNAIIHAIPYPTKANILQGNDIDIQNSNFVSIFEKILLLHKQIAESFPVVPTIATFHGNIGGSKLANGQTLIGQDIIFPTSVLKVLNANYYACGHIHLPQEVDDYMYYSGSLYNKDFGETEQKYFNVVEFEENKIINISKIKLPYTPMQVINGVFENGELKLEEEPIAGAELKIKITVGEDERALLNIKELQDKFNNAKIDINVKPRIRVQRSEEIVKVNSLVDEVKEFAQIINAKITNSIIEKIKKIEEGIQ